MQYTIDADEEFLRVKLWGRTEDRPPHEVCMAMARESERLGRYRILVEVDNATPLSPTSQYQLVSRAPEFGFTVRHRLALVHTSMEMWAANQFINLVATNRAMMVRNFRALEEAIAWLREAPAAA